MANNILKTAENVKKLIDHDVSSDEIRQYIQEQGFDPSTFKEQYKQAKVQAGWESVGRTGEILAGKTISSFGAGIPELIAKKAGYSIPEPQNAPEKIAGIVGTGLGFAGGLPIKAGRLGVSLATKVLPKLAEKKFIPAAARMGIESGVAIGTSDIPKAVQEPQKTAKEAGIGALIGAGIPMVGKAGLGALKGTERIVGGVTKGTQDWIAKRGAKVVFSPEKAQVDYIGKEIVPKLQIRLATAIEKDIPGTENMLVKLGIPKQDAVLISEISPEKRKIVSDIVRGKVGNIELELDRQKQMAGKIYGDTLRKVKPDTQINIKDTFFRLKRNLQDMGTLDLAGNFKKEINIPQLGRVPEATIATPQNKLSKIYAELQDYMKYNQGNISTQDYQRILNDELESALSNNPRWDRIVYNSQDSLRKNAVKAIPELKQANKIYSDVAKLKQINDSLIKLSEEGKQPMGVILENKILTLRDPKRYQTRETWKEILGEDLYNKTLDHIANMDYGLVSEMPGAAGGIFPSTPGILRALTTATSKKVRQMPTLNIKPSPLIPTLTKMDFERRKKSPIPMR